MTIDEAKDLIPLYALGALDPLTREEFEREIDDLPPELRNEIFEQRAVISLLPLSLDTPVVPASVRERLLVAVARQPHPGPAGKATVLPYKPDDRTGPRASTDWVRWGLLAASVVLALLTGWLWGKNRERETEAGALLHRTAELDQQIARQQTEFERILEQSTRLVSLAGQPVSPNSQARLLWDTDRNIWVIYFFGLPLVSSDQDYQLWYITRDQRKISAHVFRPNEHGRGELRVDLPGELAGDIVATAVTLEPRGGSPQPTGQMYLLASL